MLKLLCDLSKQYTRNFSSTNILNKKNSRSSSANLHELLLTMPKEETHLRDIRKIRMEKRVKRFTTQPNTIYWQVFGSGTYGGSTSLFLYTDHRRYLFNCGEGTQRLTSQLNLNRALGQLEHVFITSKSWKHLGGLPGLCLTVRSAGAPDITIHGPKGCMDLYEATKGFVTLFDFEVEAYEDGVFEDSGVRVEEVVLKRREARYCPLLNENWREDEQAEWNYSYDSDEVQAYICKFSPRPGRLDVAKCVELGVVPGPMLGQLKNGKDVTLKDGRVIRSRDVVGNSSPASSYLVLDVPELEYLDGLEASQKLRNIDKLSTVFHFTPVSVFTDPRYSAFLSSLGPEVSHVMLNESCEGLGLPDVSSYTHKLRLVREEFFPVHRGAGDITPDTDLKMHVRRPRLGENVFAAVTGLRVNVRPTTKHVVDFRGICKFDETLSTKELLEGSKVPDEDKEEYMKGIADALETAKAFTADGSETGESEDKYPEVTFLGTGSSVPSKYRNVTGILVETEPGSYMILDCGEGTLGQLVRLHGMKGVQKILLGLKCVYISHMHADHHLGLINIVQMRERALRESGQEVTDLYIVTTDRLIPFLTYYHTKFEPILGQCHHVKCERLILYNERDDHTLEENPEKKLQKLYPADLNRFLDVTGLKEFYVSRAIHCPNAFCVAFRTKAGYKIAFSGDTRPCDKFREICAWGGPPDLLIHEATMEHFMIYDAMIKKHSTFTEAIQEGKDMNAGFTLLTHFSQRYSKMPMLTEIEGKEKVGIVFDNMVVNRHNMKMIPSIYETLKRFLWDYQEELKERAELYKLKNGQDEAEGMEELDLGLRIPSQVTSKKALAEKLAKRHEEKNQWFENVRKRKLLEMKEQEEGDAKAKKDTSKSDILL